MLHKQAGVEFIVPRYGGFAIVGKKQVYRNIVTIKIGKSLYILYISLV